VLPRIVESRPTRRRFPVARDRHAEVYRSRSARPGWLPTRRVGDRSFRPDVDEGDPTTISIERLRSSGRRHGRLPSLPVSHQVESAEGMSRDNRICRSRVRRWVSDREAPPRPASSAIGRSRSTSRSGEVPLDFCRPRPARAAGSAGSSSRSLPEAPPRHVSSTEDSRLRHAGRQPVPARGRADPGGPAPLVPVLGTTHPDAYEVLGGFRRRTRGRMARRRHPAFFLRARPRGKEATARTTT
jgi:hypothetical protein